MINKLKVCLIGYGYWGPKLARNFQNSNFFNLVSVSDKSKANLLKAKKDFPLVKTSTDFKKLIINNIDLVVIATPTETHFKISKFALEKKKHILVVDYPFLFSGSINYIKKIIEKKRYGKLLEIESYREQAPIRKDVNVVWDLAVHDISILSYLLRQNPKNMKSLKMNTVNTPKADTAYINLVYKNKLNVFIKNSWISPTKIRIMKFKFKKAIIYCDENESMYKLKIYSKKNNHLKYNIEIPDIDLSEPLSNLVLYIYRTIRKKEKSMFDSLNLNVTKILKKLS